jgi:hypothetical protein
MSDCAADDFELEGKPSELQPGCIAVITLLSLHLTYLPSCPVHPALKRW